MDEYDWYLIINGPFFESLGLVSRELDLLLEGIGAATVMVTKGKFVSIIYDGAILPVKLHDLNPFYADGYGVFITDQGDIYLGVPNT